MADSTTTTPRLTDNDLEVTFELPAPSNSASTGIRARLWSTAWPPVDGYGATKEEALAAAQAQLGETLRHAPGTRRFEFGGFSQESARDISAKVVTITTHADPEAEQPGDVHERKLALYVPGKPYLMLLPEDFGGGVPEPDAVVFLTDVESVTVHEKEAA